MNKREKQNQLTGLGTIELVTRDGNLNRGALDVIKNDVLTSCKTLPALVESKLAKSGPDKPASLTRIKATQGLKCARVLVDSFVSDFIDFSGREMTSAQIIETVNIIVSERPELTAYDLTLFFKDLKAAKYGPVYHMNGASIIGALNTYCDERMALFAEHNRAKTTHEKTTRFKSSVEDRAGIAPPEATAEMMQKTQQLIKERKDNPFNG